HGRRHCGRRSRGVVGSYPFPVSLIMQTVQANGAREVAIVTGGAKGIGFGIAAELARSGRHVAIFDLDRASLEEAQAALSKEGREVLALSVDVTKSESVAQGVEAVIERFGR